MNSMAILPCVGKDGIEREFYVSTRTDTFDETICLHVRDTIEPSEDFFEVVLREQEPGLLRVVSINHHGWAKYTHKGIPAAVLTYAAQNYGCRIESSPPMSDDQKDRRSDDATRMWKGMVARGHAMLYPDRDQFYIDPLSPVGLA